MNLANTFTVLRILFVVPLSLTMAYEKYYLAIIFFALAGISDLLDGHIARRYNQKTRLGAYLDPLADKLLVFACFLTLVLQKVLPLWFFIFVFLKELSMLCGVIVFKAKKIDLFPEANIFGKTALVFQIALILEGIVQKGFFDLGPIIKISVVATTVIIIIAWFFYLKNFVARFVSSCHGS